MDNLSLWRSVNIVNAFGTLGRSQNISWAVVIVVTSLDCETYLYLRVWVNIFSPCHVRKFVEVSREEFFCSSCNYHVVNIVWDYISWISIVVFRHLYRKLPWLTWKPVRPYLSFLLIFPFSLPNRSPYLQSSHSLN